jgi:hypothetical protein
MPHTILRPHHPVNGYAHHYTQNGHVKSNGHGGECIVGFFCTEVVTHFVGLRVGGCFLIIIIILFYFASSDD